MQKTTLKIGFVNIGGAGVKGCGSEGCTGTFKDNRICGLCDNCGMCPHCGICKKNGCVCVKTTKVDKTPVYADSFALKLPNYRDNYYMYNNDEPCNDPSYQAYYYHSPQRRGR